MSVVTRLNSRTQGMDIPTKSKPDMFFCISGSGVGWLAARLLMSFDTLLILATEYDEYVMYIQGSSLLA